MPLEERERLRSLAGQWPFPVPPQALDTLLSFGGLLLAWNDRINLTGARTLIELVEAHFPDAFAIVSNLQNAETVVDVGSGGGLPAIPAAILAPQIRLLLVEPIHKKVAFLRTAIRACGLSGRVTVAAERLEGGQLDGRPVHFDLAMSRATFPPEDWLRLARPLVCPGGRVLALSVEELVSVTEGLLLEDVVAYGDRHRRLFSFKCST